MSDFRQQQMEALAMVSEYMDKLIPAMQEVSAELIGEMKEDTVDYLNQIIDAFNFVIETFNATRDLVNADEELIIESVLEEEIGNLSNAFKTKNYIKIGEILGGSLLDFVKVFNQKAKDVIA